MNLIVKRWLAFDIGCIECGEYSTPIGLFPTEAKAQEAADAAENADASSPSRWRVAIDEMTRSTIS